MLNVNLIDERKVIDGVPFGVSEKAKFVYFSDSQIKINSNDPQLIFEVIEYFEFVGLLLSERYFVQGKRELSRLYQLVEKMPSNLTMNDSLEALQNISRLDRYLEKAGEGLQAISISRPLPPKRVSASTK